ncbi:MAG: type II toxin-antitoxin system VapC family toxin [Candidatus Binatia bacterium]
MRIYDSFALLKLFQREQGYRKVARLLHEDRKADNLPLIQIINFGEIIYITKKDFGENAKLRVIRNVIQMGFRIISVPDNLVYEAAELKGSYAISYADAFLLATALRENAVIVTGDPEFKQVESLCQVEWV